MKQKPFKNLDVAYVFDNYPPKVRRKLLELRKLIFDTASKTNGVGELEETLKWGQPSYLTPQTKSGSTIRIDSIKKAPGKYAMYFHCQTTLVETFRDLYPKDFEYEGNRAIILDVSGTPPVKKLSHCIRLALTYHLNKK